MSADPVTPAASARRASDLRVRVLSAMVLAPAALVAAVIGEPAFAILLIAGGVIVLWEWLGLLPPRRLRRCLVLGGVALLAATLGLLWPAVVPGLAVFALATGAAALAAPAGARAMTALGVCYAAGLVVPAVVLRGDGAYGVAAVFFLFAVVWATDSAAYFAGRQLGGPRLAPAISPNKTWSGAIGGVIGGIAAGVLVAAIAGLSALGAISAVAFFISIASQCGDLFESWLKRRAGVKDTGRLIPGHGGLMDRVDGLVTAGICLAALGVVRGGLAAPGAGMFIW